MSVNQYIRTFWNIGFIGNSVILTQYIGKTAAISRTDKISVSSNPLLSNIRDWLSAKFNQYAIPE